MRQSPRTGRRRPASSRVVVVAAALAALASAMGGAWIGLQEMDDWRDRYGPLSGSLRDDPVGLFLGFDPDVWTKLSHSIGRGDRYAIVARGPRRFEVRNYAAYALLPAIQVTDATAADVVVHYGTGGSVPRCTSVGDGVCLVRREDS